MHPTIVSFAQKIGLRLVDLTDAEHLHFDLEDQPGKLSIESAQEGILLYLSIPTANVDLEHIRLGLTLVNPRHKHPRPIYFGLGEGNFYVFSIKLDGLNSTEVHLEAAINSLHSVSRRFTV